MEIEELKSGLTWRTILVLFLPIIVFQSALIFMSLTTGGGFGLGWITLLVAVELARMLGRPLTKQEAFIIYVLVTPVSATYFIGYIYRAYFSRTALFGLTEYIPSWWVSHVPEVWSFRTFLDSSWIIPLGLGLLFFFLTLISDITMGLFVRELYVKVEKLPFPTAEVAVQGITTLVQREEKRINSLLVGTNIGLLYSFFLYGSLFLPSLLGYPAGALPIPWADFTLAFQPLLPGAAFGVATDILIFATGFIIPFSVVVSMFIGSLAIYIIGNPLLIRYGVTEFAKEYFTAWGLSQIMQSSFTYVWAGPMVGVTMAAGVFPLLHKRDVFIQALRSLRRGGRVMPLGALLGLWLSATITSVIVAYSLLRGVDFTYFLLMLIFSTLWSFVWTIASARAIGVTGVDITVPTQIISIVKYSYINFIQLKSPILWFIDPVISTGGSSWCLNFKIAERCGCTVKSLLQVFLIILPLALATNFFLAQYFWSLAPMPSSAFPQTAIFWPISVINDSLWYSGHFFISFTPIWIIGAFIIVGGIYGLAQLAKLPISVIGLAAGMSIGNPIPMTFTMLLGSLVGLIMAKRDKAWWLDNRFVLVAGIGLGEACAITALASINIVAKALWTPF